MEALKKFDIEELLKRQAILDRKFDKKETIRKRTPGRTCVAFLTELGELGQELKSDWNYWKNHTKAEHTGATEEEFLKVHHEVWLRNTKERTKGEY